MVKVLDEVRIESEKEIYDIYLRYLYLKGEHDFGFNEYLNNNYRGNKTISLYQRVQSKGDESALKSGGRLKGFIKDGKLTDEGERYVYRKVEEDVELYIKNNDNITQKLFHIWLLLNYKRGKLTTVGYKSFITLYATALGIPELFIYYKKVPSNYMYYPLLQNERSLYTKGTAADTGVELLDRLGKHTYILTPKGKGVAEVLYTTMKAELKTYYK